MGVYRVAYHEIIVKTGDWRPVVEYIKEFVVLGYSVVETELSRELKP